MSGWSGLPRHGGAAGLFDEAAKAGFSGQRQLRIPGLQQGRQEHEDLSFFTRGGKDTLDDGIGRLRSDRRDHITISVRRHEANLRRIAEEPGEWHAQRRCDQLEDRDPRLCFTGLNGCELRLWEAAALSQCGERTAPSQPPRLDQIADLHAAILAH